MFKELFNKIFKSNYPYSTGLEVNTSSYRKIGEYTQSIHDFARNIYKDKEGIYKYKVDVNTSEFKDTLKKMLIQSVNSEVKNSSLTTDDVTSQMVYEISHNILCIMNLSTNYEGIYYKHKLRNDDIKVNMSANYAQEIIKLLEEYDIVIEPRIKLFIRSNASQVMRYV